MAKKRTKVVVQPQKKKNKVKKQELTRLGYALRTLGGLGGGAVGGLVGMPSSGSAVGSGIGAALSKWLGSGDYQVSSNSMVSSMKASGSIPMMHKNDQTVVVRHKEFIGEIRSSIDFATRYSLELNPGVSSTFPWLSRIAGNYQEYRFKGIVFHYVPTSGSAVASTNNALGSVMMQTSYRATDTPPASKRELLNEYWSTETAPFETTCHPIECNPSENPFNVQYVRQKSVPVGDNLLMYDLGVTHIAVSGQQVNDVVLGDLWVTYEVELKKPILYSNVTNGEGQIVTYDTTPSAAVKSGTYLSTIDTAVLPYSGNKALVPQITGVREWTIPAEFQGVIWIQASIAADITPFITADYISWSGAATVTGSLTALPALAGSSRWESVYSVGTSTVRRIFYSAAFLKNDLQGGVEAKIALPQCVFLATGDPSLSFQAVITLQSS
nr:structural protein [Tolivirales sp.]